MFRCCIFFLFSFCFAADYVIDTVGKSQEQIDSIVKSLPKDSNIIFKNSETTTDVGDSRFLGIGLNTNIDYNAKKGEEIYSKNCKSCHGAFGEKRILSTSSSLKDLTSEQIFNRFRKYGVDATYGGNLKHSMQPVSKRLNQESLGYIIAYIKGQEDPFLSGDSNDDIKNSDISTEITDRGSYIE